MRRTKTSIRRSLTASRGAPATCLNEKARRESDVLPDRHWPPSLEQTSGHWTAEPPKSSETCALPLRRRRKVARDHIHVADRDAGQQRRREDPLSIRLQRRVVQLWNRSHDLGAGDRAVFGDLNFKDDDALNARALGGGWIDGTDVLDL